MDDVHSVVNVVEGKMDESNKTKVALAKSAGNEMARHGRKLFFSQGLNKVTDEATYQAVLIHCGRLAGYRTQVEEGLRIDGGNKFVNDVGPKVLKAISVTDRSIRQKVRLVIPCQKRAVVEIFSCHKKMLRPIFKGIICLKVLVMYMTLR